MLFDRRNLRRRRIDKFVDGLLSLSESDMDGIHMKTVNLGFGMLRYPVSEGKMDCDKWMKAVDSYMEGDFCYFDMHPAYASGLSERCFREMVAERYPRNRYLAANKMPYYGIENEQDYERILEDELLSCGLEYFDYYLVHALTKERNELHTRMGGYQFLLKAKKEGRVKHIGFSFHGTPELLDEILSTHPEMEFVQLQINYLDWMNPAIRSRELYDTALKHKKPIFVMEPIKGGALASWRMVDGLGMSQSVLAKKALSFVAALPGIRIILSGMVDAEQVHENRSTIREVGIRGNESSKIWETYLDLITYAEHSNKIPCTNCRYCGRVCPMKIAVPEIISILNSVNNMGENDITYDARHRSIYTGTIEVDRRAGSCIQCGACERECPQNIKIREHLKEAKTMFENVEKLYTAERNTQILIYLMKEHGIRRVIVSPGTTNKNFVWTLQHDDFFMIYNVVDERSAAYMACGMAEETGEPVAISCTQATAPRNYIPGMTEAYYRKLPVLAVTSTHRMGHVGQNMPRVTDRKEMLSDAASYHGIIPMVHDEDDEWSCGVKVNEALLALSHYGGGPVWLELETGYETDFFMGSIPPVRVIHRVTNMDDIPVIPTGNVAIYCGAHSVWEDGLTQAVDVFCEKFNAVVLCDHMSNYHGKYGILPTLIYNQEGVEYPKDYDLMIHIGNVCRNFYEPFAKEVWRVNSDGRIADTFRALTNVFEMSELSFFEKYNDHEKDTEKTKGQCKIYEVLSEKYKNLTEHIPELPLSSVWCAKELSAYIPADAVLHLCGAYLSKCFSMFEFKSNRVMAYANSGGCGIDGPLSSFIGASLADSDRLYFGVIGDLAFFYDMNCLGNRHIGNNIRILMVNNDCGMEMAQYRHPVAKMGKQACINLAAMGGHYSAKSERLVEDYAEDLGFSYYRVESKEDFKRVLPDFIDVNRSLKPIFVEVITDDERENIALKQMFTIASADVENASKEVVHKNCIAVPRHFESFSDKEVVLFGAGNHFRRYQKEVRKKYSVRYVCDNNESLWGKNFDGIKCISPEELKSMTDVFVCIMIADSIRGFQVANQLIDMGITCFDTVENFILYEI